MSLTEKEINDYSEKISKPESEFLKQIYRETHLKVMNPIMLSGHLQGKLLQLLSSMIKPHFALEIGTFTAYSAICIAQGLPKGGKLITIEINPELESICRKNIIESGMEEKIELQIGDAIKLIPDIDNMLDMVYIDCDKEKYLEVYNLVIDKVAPAGFIIADNVLWHGKVFEKNAQKDRETKAICDFNTFVCNDKRVDNLLLPFRDGLMIIQRL
jgi:caffeoyl-CoA O-methyltransferase